MGNELIYILGLVAAGLGGLIALRLLLRYPESALALFVAAYVLKGGINIGYFNLTAILLFISLVGFFMPAIKGRAIRFSVKATDLWLFVFLIVLFGGTYLAPNPQGGVIKAALFTGAVVLPYLIARLFFKTYGQIHVFLVTTLGIATTIATALVVLSFTPLYTGGRLQILKANPIPTGTLLAIGLVIAVIGLTSDLLGKSKKSKGFCIAAILLCLYGLFLSGVRGPLISAIVGLAFYFFTWLVRRPRVVAVVGAVAILLLVTFDMWYPHVPNIGGYRLQAIIQGLSTQD